VHAPTPPEVAAAQAAGGAVAAKLGPLAPMANPSLKSLAYDAIKAAIAELDVYAHDTDLRLDERQLSQELGISRTPVREALTMLVQEGFVRQVPRRGLFVVRHSKREIIDMIQCWASLEGMAARLAAARARKDEIRALRGLFEAFEQGPPVDHLHEYSRANLVFHGSILRLGGNATIEGLTGNLLIHMRAIRSVSVRQGRRAERSMEEHGRIIDALEARDAPLAEALVRDHALGLAEHVARYGTFDD
jgi:DNA-binding GntR family transcriptional regulator